MTIDLLPRGDTRWDCVSLGEVMLRLDPGFGRVRTARSFEVHEGGGEYNVARAISKVFGMRSAVVTALVDNEVGRLAEDLMMAGGVSLDHVSWVPFDGLGFTRVGLNFTEKGFGIRPPLGVSDRANSAASKMKPGDVDWPLAVPTMKGPDGSTPVGSSPACPIRAQSSRWKGCRQPDRPGPWCPMTSTSVRRSGESRGVIRSP